MTFDEYARREKYIASLKALFGLSPAAAEVIWYAAAAMAQRDARIAALESYITDLKSDKTST